MARGSQPQPQIVLATKPVTIAVPAHYNVQEGTLGETPEVSFHNPAPTPSKVFFDRGFTVLAAALPSWGLVDRDPHRPATIKGLPATVVHARHELAAITNMMTADGELDTQSAEAAFSMLMEWAKTAKQTAWLFKPSRTSRVPTLQVGTLAELGRTAGWSVIEEAARTTGAANSKGCRSYDHLGVVHDLAMLGGHHLLVQACRQGAQRYKAAA